MKDYNAKIKKELIMKNEEGQVKTECFYWNSERNQFYSMGKEDSGRSLNFFLLNVSYIDSQIIPGANILVLFYTK